VAIVEAQAGDLQGIFISGNDAVSGRMEKFI